MCWRPFSSFLCEIFIYRKYPCGNGRMTFDTCIGLLAHARIAAFAIVKEQGYFRYVSIYAWSFLAKEKKENLLNSRLISTKISYPYSRGSI
jgi:hypothetical protein